MDGDFSEPVHIGLTTDQFSTPPDSPRINPQVLDSDDSEDDSTATFTKTVEDAKAATARYFSGIDAEFEELKERNQRALKESQAAVQTLSGTLGELRQHASRNRDIMCERVKQLKTMKQEVEDICQKTAEELMPEKSQLEEEVKATESLIDDMTQFVITQEKTASSEETEVKQQLAMLEECTGLQILSLSGDRTQILLKNVSEECPQKEVGIILRVVGQEYQVVQCQPPISTIDDLTLKLNATNNLRKFVIELRKEFQQELARAVDDPALTNGGQAHTNGMD